MTQFLRELYLHLYQPISFYRILEIMKNNVSKVWNLIVFGIFLIWLYSYHIIIILYTIHTYICTYDSMFKQNIFECFAIIFNCNIKSFQPFIDHQKKTRWKLQWGKPEISTELTSITCMCLLSYRIEILRKGRYYNM